MDATAKLSVENTLLQNIDTSESFLPSLETCYRQLGIGRDLPFSAIAAYWHQGTPLSDAWLDELARHARCDLLQRGENWGWNENHHLKRIHSLLLTNLPPTQWPVIAEKCLYLLCGILLPQKLADWIDFTKESAWQKIKQGTLCAAQVDHLLPIANALAEGRDGWEGVHAWLREAEGDPALLHTTLRDIPAEQWHARNDYSANLNAQLILLTLARLLLRVETGASPRWSELLLPMSSLLSLSERVPVGRQEHQTLRRHLTRPLIEAALASPDLVELLIAQSEIFPLNRLLDELELAVPLARQPERYRALLDGIGDDQLRYLWPTKALVEQVPDMALYQVRQRFERCQVWSDIELTSPEALAWYREVLPRLHEQREFERCARLLAAHQSEADTLALLERHYSRGDRNVSHSLLEAITDSDALQRFLTSDNPHLRTAAAYRLARLALRRTVTDTGEKGEGYQPDPALWPQLLAQCEHHPDLFIQSTLNHYRLHPAELARWELLWHRAGSDELRVKIADELLDACRGDYGTETGADPLALASRLYQENPLPFRSAVANAYEYSLDEYVAALGRTESLLWQLIPQMAARYLGQSTWLSGPVEALNAIPIRRALSRYPESYSALEEKAKIKLLPLFDDAALTACGTSLVELFDSGGKNLHIPAVQLVARSSLTALRDSGLLNAARKTARKRVLTGLGLNPADDLTPLLRELIRDKAHDDYSRGLMLDNLEGRGESVAEEDDWADLTIARLQALAAEQKIPAATAKLWNAELADCLRALGETAGQYLLQLLLQSGVDAMPRRARQALELIPAGRRADFAAQCVAMWIATNGSEKLNPLVLPLYRYGDERAANALVKACKAWKKTRKPKASAAIRLLCKIPGTYGVAQAQALWESRQFSDSIMHNAKRALTEAAAAEGLSLEEFLEQLVPDLGLSREGLVLDVGPYGYTVKIKPDLSLLIVDSQGKATKSLPKAKAGEDADKRSLAENQFKSLKKNLKPILKQQSQRLLRALTAGKRWNAPLWRRLFAEHPLMAIIAQGVVWSAEDAAGNSLFRFRPSDTGELLNLEDDTIALDDSQIIHVTHPVDVSADERAAWRQHLEDYAVTSPLAQWDIPVYHPTPAERDAQQVTRHSGVELNRGKFGSLMEKWGYQKGAGEDGAMINEHTWLASRNQWLVRCEHSGVSVFFEADEEVAFEALVPYRYNPQPDGHHWQPVTLKELPTALLATLLAQAEALKAAANG